MSGDIRRSLGGIDEAMFRDRVTPRRKGPKIIDDSGGRVNAYNAGLSLPCYIEQAMPQTVPDLMVVGNKVQTVVYFPESVGDPGLGVEDILDVHLIDGGLLGYTNGNYDGRSLIVQRVRKEGQAGFLYRADCSERN